MGNRKRIRKIQVTKTRAKHTAANADPFKGFAFHMLLGLQLFGLNDFVVSEQTVSFFRFHTFVPLHLVPTEQLHSSVVSSGRSSLSSDCLTLHLPDPN
jgi:G:T-mismatch repair DNA endonuclease (very short patch repair protein)